MAKGKGKAEWSGHEIVTVNGSDYLRVKYINGLGQRASQWRKLGPVMDDFDTHRRIVPVPRSRTRSPRRG